MTAQTVNDWNFYSIEDLPRLTDDALIDALETKARWDEEGGVAPHAVALLREAASRLGMGSKEKKKVAVPDASPRPTGG